MVFAVNNNGPAVEAYKALHGQSHGCLQADMFAADTLRLATQAKPAVLAMGFPCQPYSTAGARRGFDDPRASMLVALLAYASILRPQALTLENVLGFATEQEGRYAGQLRYALAVLTPAFAMLAETSCLRSVRPLKRTRWLAVCPRQATWQSMTNAARQTTVTAEWQGRSSTLTGLGIPCAARTKTDLDLTDDLRQRYQAPTYLPRGFHSRFLQDWQAIPCWTHSAGSEFTPCPCGCHPRGLGEAGLRNKGALTLLVRTPQGARLPAPEEIAQAMGFPPHAFWETVGPRLGLAFPGNAISPLHGARAMGKLSILCAMLQQSPLPADYIALTTDRILRLADHGPTKVVTTPTPAPAPAPKDPLPHDLGTRFRTGAAHTEEVEPSPRQIEGSSVAITVVAPGPNLIRMDVMDDRTMTDLKAVLHILGHLSVVQGTFALDGRPFLDHTPLYLAGIQDGSVVALLPGLDKPMPCPPPPPSPQGGLQSATGSIRNSCRRL